MKEVDHFTPETLFEKYQLTHEQFIDLKALMGDPSDNIPGVPGLVKNCCQTFTRVPQLR